MAFLEVAMVQLQEVIRRGESNWPCERGVPAPPCWPATRHGSRRGWRRSGCSSAASQESGNPTGRTGTPPSGR